MTIYNFDGNNGDPMPNGITTESGVAEIWSNKAKASSLGGSSVAEITADGLADGTISCVYNAEGNGGANTGGLIFRFQDTSNYWLAGISPSQGNFRLMRLQGGFQIVDTYVIPSFDPSADYTIEVTTSGTSINCSLNGTPRLSGTSTIFQNETKSGFRFADTTGTCDTLNVPTGATGLSVSNAPFDNFIYQRGVDGTRNMSFSVTYGGADEPLEYRLLDATDGTTEVQTWQVFDASPSGGGSTLSFNWPGGLTPILVEVRKNTETDMQLNGWYVGINALLYGQSLAQRLSTEGSILNLPHYFENKGAGNVVPTTGTGARQLASKLQDIYSCAVVFANSAVGGSDLTQESAVISGAGNAYWANENSSLYTSTQAEVDNMTDSEGRLEFALWIQGQTDAVNSIPTGTYLRINEYGGLNYLLMNSRGDWKAKDGGVLPIVCGTLGKNTSTSGDIQAQQVRDGILKAVNVDDLLYPLTIHQYATVDGTHPTNSENEILANDVAAIVALANNDVTHTDASPYSLNVSGSDIILSLSENIDNSVTEFDTQCWAVFDNSVPMAINSISKTGDAEITISLTLAPVTTNISVIFGYGTGLDNTALAIPLSEPVSLPGSGGSHLYPLKNFNATVID